MSIEAMTGCAMRWITCTDCHIATLLVTQTIPTGMINQLNNIHHACSQHFISIDHVQQSMKLTELVLIFNITHLQSDEVFARILLLLSNVYEQLACKRVFYIFVASTSEYF